MTIHNYTVNVLTKMTQLYVRAISYTDLYQRHMLKFDKLKLVIK